MKFLEGTDIVIALALTQSETEMAREDYEKISFSQWNNIAEKTGWSYHPELRELSLKWMFNLIDNDLSTFKQCKQLMLREGLSEQLERLMFDKAKTFEDWLYIHIHFTDNQSYQNQSFEEMSRLEGEFASYVKLLEINFENRESRFFKLAEKKIFQVEHRINVTDWARGSNKFDQYFKLVALNKNIEYANSFSDWNNIFIHEIELEQRNSPQCVKCFEGMYATAGRSINYLDILYDLLIAIQKGCEFSIEKEYFEKNNSQRLKINEMIQSIIDQMRIFIVEIKGLVPTHNNYWVKFYKIAEEKGNLEDQKLILDGLNSLEAKKSFWENLEKYQRNYHPKIADIAFMKIKEALTIAS